MYIYIYTKTILLNHVFGCRTGRPGNTLHVSIFLFLPAQSRLPKYFQIRSYSVNYMKANSGEMVVSGTAEKNFKIFNLTHC